VKAASPNGVASSSTLKLAGELNLMPRGGNLYVGAETLSPCQQIFPFKVGGPSYDDYTNTRTYLGCFVEQREE